MSEEFINKGLRWVAIIGFLIMILTKAESLLKLNDQLTILVMIHVVLFVGIAMLFFNQSKLVIRHLDLLVPLGVYSLLNEFVGFIGFPASVDLVTLDLESRGLVFTGITLYKVLFWLYLVVSGVIYVGWVMFLIFDIIKNNQTNLFKCLMATLQNILKIGIVISVGWLFVFVCTMYFPLLSVNIYASTMLLFIILLIWNFFTAPTIYCALKHNNFSRAVLVDSIKLAWKNPMKIFPIIFLYSILVGNLIIIPVFFIHEDWGQTFQNMSFYFANKGVWLGGFPNLPGWFSAVTKAYGISGNSGIKEIVILLFSILAIVIKIRLVQLFEND
jgi:hypothetical protein